MVGAVCCVFPDLLASLFTPVLIAISYAGHTKIVIIRSISETISLYTPPYYGNLNKATCFGCVRQPPSGFVFQKYRIMYFCSTKPDDGTLCTSEIRSLLMIETCSVFWLP
jgi:hypothetical protein